MVQNLCKKWLLVWKITWGVWIRQAVESPKSWNLIGYFSPKKNIRSAKTLYTEGLFNITLNYLFETPPNSSCNFWNNKSFFTIQLVCIFLAQTLRTFDKISSLKCKFSDFPLLELKFTKFFMPFFKQKVSFSSKFASPFSFMTHNSSKSF